jgi:hypothetical protein
VSDKGAALAVREHPRARTQRVEVSMSTHRILREGLKDEVRRKVVKEAEERYRHQLMPDEERQVVRDRVLRLRRELGLRS